MAWRLSGTYVANCSCQLICPCPVDAPPTGPDGQCRGVLVFDVNEGNQDDTDLSGTCFALCNLFPSNLTAGNDSTKATYCSGMRALMEHPDQRQLLLDDPSLIPGAVEESLRMFPAFAHFRRTATRDTELNGCPIRRGDKVVMWYVSSNRDESRYEDADRFDVTRNPEHQAFGAGGRHFCLGTALARLELRIMFEETLARFPDMELAGPVLMAESGFINQPKTVPVRLGGRSTT